MLAKWALWKVIAFQMQPALPLLFLLEKWAERNENLSLMSKDELGTAVNHTYMNCVNHSHT